ncbi:YggS family pyridoxal phosphate-dependent enzyme [Empedobacter sp.]|uniref:YggS family pyridoxal phosphate-dependent enzyme n=1 Tax=Empedobacter sp. TaxID=1927715 RepID=UPI0028AA9FFF|nr:YggS family pyridoxal phosphate-dependent enzyme [Empedobacter sp.]
MSIQENLKTIEATIPAHVTLVAVSKTKPVEDLQEAYAAGMRDFGENKIQEMCDKYEVLPKDIRWHMIGHVQTNKVKYMAPFVHLIHGVDSLKLLKEINKQAKKNNRVIDVLLQQFIADEETKFGLDQEEIQQIMQEEIHHLPNVRVVGLMGMATFTEDENQIREEFRSLKFNFDSLKNNFENLTVLSMGMSGDYQIAIEEGSTMVRIGSSIFGHRNYSI